MRAQCAAAFTGSCAAGGPRAARWASPSQEAAQQVGREPHGGRRPPARPPEVLLVDRLGVRAQALQLRPHGLPHTGVFSVLISAVDKQATACTGMPAHPSNSMRICGKPQVLCSLRYHLPGHLCPSERFRHRGVGRSVGAQTVHETPSMQKRLTSSCRHELKHISTHMPVAA